MALLFCFFLKRKREAVGTTQWKEQWLLKTVEYMCLIYYQHFCEPVSHSKMFYILFPKEAQLL